MGIRVINRATGEAKEVSGPKDVGAILKELGLLEGTVLVTREGELLTRDERVEEGSILEIVPVVSGG